MVILGIDPGTTRIGFGVIKKEGASFYLCASGIFNHPQHPNLFEKELLTLVKTHKPEAVAIETIFFTKNQKTVFAVAEMRGVIKFLIQKQEIPILEFTPLEVKQHVTGYGRADKKQVELMAFKILSLSKKPKYDDESDAIAIALSGALMFPMYLKTRSLPG